MNYSSLRKYRLWPVALTLIVLIVGCTTRRQVEDAVTRSNMAMLSGLGGLNPQPGSAGDWHDAAAKLENLIAEHPDNPPLVAALRLRQAVLYLHAGQLNLAEAAFDEVKPADLHTSRDSALKSLQGSLLWWYAAANHPYSRSAGVNGRDDYLQASNALVAIGVEWFKLKLPDDQGIADYLAFMRAFIGVKLANDIVGISAAQIQLTNTLNTFSAMLPPGETERWLTIETNWPPKNVSPDVAVLPKLHRRFETEAVLKAAVVAISNNAIPGPLLITNQFFLKEIRP